MNPLISDNCPGLPGVLAKHLDQEFSNIQAHYALGEWADLLVDAGRFGEAVLRLLEWKMRGTFTPVDGKSKPGRSVVVNSARQDLSLQPSVRLQVVAALELVLDFRNNRNAAHLGDIDPNEIDAITVFRLASWIMGEIIRLESNLKSAEITALLSVLAQRPIPLIHHINGRPIVLSSKVDSKDTILVLLYDSPTPQPVGTLFKWTQHSHITRWRATALKPLVAAKMIFIENGVVHLLPPGVIRAEKVIAESV